MTPKEILTRELLIREYLVNKLSIKQIATKFKIKSSNSVSQYIKKYDLHRPNKKRAETYITEQELYKKYILENKGLKEIAHEIGFRAKHSIKRLLKKYNIPIRKHTSSTKKENAHYKYRKHKYITSHYWSSIKSDAKRRHLDFKISIDQCWKIFIIQKHKCAISGVKIRFRSPFEDKTCQTASLDRIDSNVGYIKSNIQWVHKDVNRMKMDLDEKKFINWCKLISENNS